MIMINTDKPGKIRVNHNYLRRLRSFALDERYNSAIVEPIAGMARSYRGQGA